MKPIERCKKHKPLEPFGLSWFTEMEKREKKGMKQKQCPVCKLWLFKDEF